MHKNSSYIQIHIKQILKSESMQSLQTIDTKKTEPVNPYRTTSSEFERQKCAKELREYLEQLPDKHQMSTQMREKPKYRKKASLALRALQTLTRILDLEKSREN